ncbi:response regulator transcription factor [Nocardioides sp.]|uniref:helix-turn-helix transcriptional regulator n=1 Tax=Nocardioides sp. TaxID=35761 RepID=UPI0035110617
MSSAHLGGPALASAAPGEGARLLRTLGEFKALGGADVAFGGPVSRGGAGLDITGLHGTRTRSLQGLHVRARRGLGGQALALGRPVSVTSYHDARGITHHYDEPVRAERLQTVTALPIIVDRAPRMVLYLAHRAEVRLGDVWFERLLPLTRRLERDISVDDEVRRRLAHLLPRATRRPAAGTADLASTPATADTADLTRSDLGEIAAELGALADLVDDDRLRARLATVQQRLERGRGGTAHATPQETPHLSAREVDVLAEVALGHTNREVAEALGLVESTVKGYLKGASRKLGASNRVHAVRLAREAGLID